MVANKVTSESNGTVLRVISFYFIWQNHYITGYILTYHLDQRPTYL